MGRDVYLEWTEAMQVSKHGIVICTNRYRCCLQDCVDYDWSGCWVVACPLTGKNGRPRDDCTKVSCSKAPNPERLISQK